MAANQPTPDFDDELLSAYVDDELTPDERATVEERLRTNEGARQTLAELQRAADAVKALPVRGLGRDLSANIWAAIDEAQAQPPAADEPTVITLLERDTGRPGSKGRGGLWTMLAIAAALLVMVTLAGRSALERQRETAAVGAAGESELKDKQGPKDPRADMRDLARVEPAEGETRTTAAARELQESRTAEPQSDAVPPAGRSGDDRAAPRLEATPSRDLASRQAPTASQALSSTPASAPEGVAPSKSVAQAESAEADALEAMAERVVTPDALRTIEVSATGVDGVAMFERVLAEHEISLVDGEFPPVGGFLAASGAAAETKATAKEEFDGAQVDGVAEGDGGKVAAPVAFMVEASAQAIADLLAAFDRNSGNRYSLARSAADAAEMEIVAGGEAVANDEAAALAGANRNVAWRVPLDAYVDDSTLMAKSAAAGDGAAPATMAAAPAEARGGYGGGGGAGLGGGGRAGGGFGGRGGGVDEARMRVLFIVRPE
jgi:hypothetical protein